MEKIILGNENVTGFLLCGNEITIKILRLFMCADHYCKNL